MPNTKSVDCDLAIIGAGASGLSCARTFALKYPQSKISIFEARNRIGGRIYSQKIACDQHIEYGAEFVHNCTKEMKRLITATGLTTYQSLQHSNNLVIDGDTRYTVGNLFSLLPRQITRSDIYADAFKQLKKIPIGTLRAFFNTAAAYFGADPDMMSSRFSVDDEVDADLLIDGPYCQLLDQLWQEVSHHSSKLYLNTVIKYITWDSLFVNLFDHNHQKVISAKKLIVTVPLSLLETLTFSPKIDFSSLYNTTAMGYLLKVVVTANFPGSYSSIFCDRNFFPIWRIISNKKALAWVGGQRAYLLGKDPNFDVQKAVSSDLKAMFSYCPKISDFYYHNWVSDLWSLGSYSYKLPIKNTKITKINSYNQINIYFAGEAFCDPKHMGTVHGAIESGKKAALLI